MNKKIKIYLRKDAIKKFRKGNVNASKDEFKGFVTGFNMCFDIMFKKYSKLKKESANK